MLRDVAASSSQRGIVAALLSATRLPVVSVDLSLKAFVKIPVQKDSASLFLSHGCRSFPDEKCSSLELHKYFKIVFIQKAFLRLLPLLAGLQGTHPGLS